MSVYIMATELFAMMMIAIESGTENRHDLRSVNISWDNLYFTCDNESFMIEQSSESDEAYHLVITRTERDVIVGPHDVRRTTTDYYDDLTSADVVAAVIRHLG